MKLVYDVGINDKKGSSNTKEYRLWTSMLKRCYCKNYQSSNSTYIGCSVSENFKLLSYFHDWCQNQVGFKNAEWQLDKDILVKGNKVYSEDICVFVPPMINGMLEKDKKTRGSLPIGVYFNEKRGCFVAHARLYGKFTYLGGFTCKEDAFNKYKEEKEKYIKFAATQWKDHIDRRAFDSLMSYSVDITD